MGFILLDIKFEFIKYDDNWLIDLIFLNSLHSLQKIVHSNTQQVWVCQVWWYMIDWFDLPKLSTLTLASCSFSETKSITLSSTSLISSSSDVPFSNGHFSMSTKKSYDGDYTFQHITSSTIISDSTSSYLKKCILRKLSSWFFSCFRISFHCLLPM